MNHIDSLLGDIRRSSELASEHVRDGFDEDAQTQARLVLHECDALRAKSQRLLAMWPLILKQVLAEIEAHEDSANICLAAMSKSRMRGAANLGVCSAEGT